MRFSKARLVDALRNRAEHYQKKWSFDPRNGTAQLLPAKHIDARNQAVDYGKYIECSNLADWIEEGSWP